MAITYFTTKQNQLITLFEDHFDVQAFHQPKGLLKKVFSKTIPIDLFFQFGLPNQKNFNLAKEAKICIVSSKKEKYTLSKLSIDSEKIKVIYPSISELEYINKKELFFEQFNIPQEFKLIFFSSHHFQRGGAKEFIQHISQLNTDKFKAVMMGSQKDIEMIRFYLKRDKQLESKIILLQFDNENFTQDDLFEISDIYVAPTKIEAFSNNVLKAMQYKSAVFVSSYNGAFEIVDTYSKMDGCDDASLAFKLDILLTSNEELEKIKEENFLRTQQYSTQYQLEQLQSILDKIST